MQPRRFLPIAWPVMAAATIELIILLCTLHWTQHLLTMPIRSTPLTYGAAFQQAPEQVPDYQVATWAIAGGLSGLLWTLARSLLTPILTRQQSGPLSQSERECLLQALFLALAALVILALVHRTTILALTAQ